MRNSNIRIFLTVFAGIMLTFSANAQVKKSCQGKWSFEAPEAPAGYTLGVIEIKKDTVRTSFGDGSYYFNSQWVKARNDSIIYQTVVDGTDVLFSLKVENEAKISGSGVWDGGETSMILKRKTQ